LARATRLLRAAFVGVVRRVNAGEVGRRSCVLAGVPCAGATNRGGPTHGWRGPRHGRDEGRAAWRFGAATSQRGRARVPSSARRLAACPGLAREGRARGRGRPRHRRRAPAADASARAGGPSSARAPGHMASAHRGVPRRRQSDIERAGLRRRPWRSRAAPGSPARRSAGWRNSSRANATVRRRLTETARPS
jgi:hypothetical protein